MKVTSLIQPACSAIGFECMYVSYVLDFLFLLSVNINVSLIPSVFGTELSACNIVMSALQLWRNTRVIYSVVTFKEIKFREVQSFSTWSFSFCLQTLYSQHKTIKLLLIYIYISYYTYYNMRYSRFLFVC